jgi:hypothetical protein
MDDVSSLGQPPDELLSGHSLFLGLAIGRPRTCVENENPQALSIAPGHHAYTPRRHRGKRPLTKRGSMSG